MTTKFSKQFVDEYSLFLLNWAKGKTGTVELAEELVQEVWVQFFHAAEIEEKRGNTIQKPENFLWKIAHYVWCNFLRSKKSSNGNNVSVNENEIQIADNESNFVEKLIEDEENKKLISYMRQTIMKLNYLQREILISFYIDGKSQKEIAENLNVSVSTVKWHLFDTRKKVKEEIITMENKNTLSDEFVYRPKHLHMAINGSWAPELDTNKINESLSKQNICIACYEKPQTIEKLNQMLGIPKPYLEEDLHWLVEKDFLKLENNEYSTIFSITTYQNSQDIYGIYLNLREKLSDIIIEELENAEEKIKACGFYGNDLPMEKLLWFLIYFLCSGFDLKIEDANIERPIRSDGGKYFPLGFDCTEYENLHVNLDTSFWSMNGPMSSGMEKHGGFLWYGLYNFGESEIIDIVMEKYKEENRPLTKLLMEILDTYDGKTFNFSVSTLNENQKETLALLIKKGFVHLKNDYAYPNFCVFNKTQMEEITPIMQAIGDKLESALKKLVEELQIYYESKIPAHLKYMKPLFVKQSASDIGWLTTLLAFNDKKLFVPENNEIGQFLTLLYVKYNN